MNSDQSIEVRRNELRLRDAGDRRGDRHRVSWRSDGSPLRSRKTPSRKGRREPATTVNRRRNPRVSRTNARPFVITWPHFGSSPVQRSYSFERAGAANAACKPLTHWTLWFRGVRSSGTTIAVYIGELGDESIGAESA